MKRYANLDYALLLIRLIFAFRLIYGSVDNVVSWDRMLEFAHFLESNSFPFPVISAVLSVYVQFIGGLMWVAGFKTKVVSLILVANFLVAIFAVHVVGGDGYLATAPAIHILAVAIVLYLTGPGRVSVDHRLKPTDSASNEPYI